MALVRVKYGKGRVDQNVVGLRFQSNLNRWLICGDLERFRWLNAAICSHVQKDTKLSEGYVGGIGEVVYLQVVSEKKSDNKGHKADDPEDR